MLDRLGVEIDALAGSPASTPASCCGTTTSSPP